MSSVIICGNQDPINAKSVSVELISFEHILAVLLLEFDCVGDLSSPYLCNHTENKTPLNSNTILSDTNV